MSCPLPMDRFSANTTSSGYEPPTLLLVASTYVRLKKSLAGRGRPTPSSLQQCDCFARFYRCRFRLQSCER
jgi:hypothetical protein